MYLYRIYTVQIRIYTEHIYPKKLYSIFQTNGRVGRRQDGEVRASKRERGGGRMERWV
jgi:hypothetical protein